MDGAIAELQEEGGRSSLQQETTENAAASNDAPATAQKNETWTIFRVITTGSLLLPLSLVVVPNFAQQVIYYATSAVLTCIYLIFVLQYSYCICTSYLYGLFLVFILSKVLIPIWL